MSKMSKIAMELDEHAVELGFADHLEAMANGYDWGIGEDGIAFLFKVEDEQQKAHEAWLKEKEEVLTDLKAIHRDIEVGREYNKELLRAIKFIERGGC